VFSIVREIESYDEGDAAVYIESDPTYVSQLFPSTLLGFDVQYVLAGADGTVLYRSAASPGASTTARGKPGIDRGFSTVRYSSPDGWSLDVHVPNRALQRPMNVWLLRYILIGTLSLSFGLLAALVVWRRFYRRIGTVSHEMLLAAEESFANPISFSGIVEIDEMLSHLESMRCRVLELVAEVEREEAARGAIELEKLRNQINPHFLHNTLNNIQWLARMAGQREIDRIVTLLTRILHYNLGKEGPVVRLEEELSIIRSYLDLQTMRYDFEYTIDSRLSADELGWTVPRFVLQPLVENAVYHGVAEDGGTVEVTAQATDGAVAITVTDDGPGIDAEAIERLLEHAEDRPPRVNGLGVGLGFVAKTMESYYGGRRHVFVTNREPRGAAVTLLFPAPVAETNHQSGE
jgi:two-component system sensor histidine kinase YesM